MRPFFSFLRSRFLLKKSGKKSSQFESLVFLFIPGILKLDETNFGRIPNSRPNQEVCFSALVASPFHREKKGGRKTKNTSNTSTPQPLPRNLCCITSTHQEQPFASSCLWTTCPRKNGQTSNICSRKFTYHYKYIYIYVYISSYKIITIYNKNIPEANYGQFMIDRD